jgi:rare lipoprotein A
VKIRQVLVRLIILLFLALITISCAGKRPAGPPGAVGYQTGLASWYGHPYHGRVAASGEVYNMYRMTAAHRTLPFETQVRVTNMKNRKQVQVRINDRGPFVPDRIIDLSYAAAKKLGMIVAGIVPVRLEILGRMLGERGGFTVQVGAFSVRENALALKERLDGKFSPVFIISDQSPWGPIYRVRVGKLEKEEEATTLARALADEGLPAMVSRIDEN